MKHQLTLWILALTLNCAWGSPVISRSYHDIGTPIDHYGESKRDVMMRCQNSMHTFTNLVQHIASTNKQMRDFLQSIDDTKPARVDYYHSGILEPGSYSLIWPRRLYEERPLSIVQAKFLVTLSAHEPHTKSDDEFYQQMGWCLLIYDLTNSVSIIYRNGNEEEPLNHMLKNCILEAYQEFDRYIPHNNNPKGEQPVAGYPPQGVGSPEP